LGKGPICCELAHIRRVVVLAIRLQPTTERDQNDPGGKSMRHQFIFGTVLAAAMAVAVSAQSSYQSEKPSGKKETVTLTGCVQKADQATGTAGTTGTTTPPTTPPTTTTADTSSASNQFVLTNVMASTSSATTTTGTTGATTTSPSASSYPNGLRLTPSASDDLQKFLNHKVEVKGTIENASSEMTAGAAAGSTKPPTLRVSSIKELSDSCSSQR